MRGLHCGSLDIMANGKPVILVVEDDALVRTLAVVVAEDSGFEVLSAASADEAIPILESRSDIRLVFTDVSMPGSMNGLKLAHVVRDRWPPVELLVTSAFSNFTVADLPKRSRFLAKPYNVGTLAKTLQQMAGA